MLNTDPGTVRARSAGLSTAELVGNLPAAPLILRILCDTTGLGFAAITRLTDTTWTACAVLDRIGYGLAAGTECDVTDTMCRSVLASRQPVVIAHASQDPVFRNHPAPGLYRFESYVGVPIIQKNGRLFGTICALDPAPKALVEADILPSLLLFAELVATQLDIDDHMAALEDSQRRLGFALTAGRLGNWDLDLATDRLTISDICARNFGLGSRHEIARFSTVRQAIHPGDRARQQAAMDHVLATGEELDIEHRIHWPDGTLHWIRIVGHPIRDDDGAVASMVGLSLDITDRRNAESELVRLAHYDPLTELANRRLMDRRIGEAILAVPGSAPNSGRIALLRLDIDQFKTVNDTFGHAVGDIVLRSIASRLLGCVGPDALVARYGGDEFALLLTDVASRAVAEACVARVVQRLAVPHAIEGREIQVSASIGIALSPDDALDAVKLWRNADNALYRAKASGRGRTRFYEASMDTRRQFADGLALTMPLAAERGELRLHYQPLVDLQSGTICCFEALLRWQHPLLGLLSPIDFVGLAEETGAIVRFGAWALREACREALSWPDTVSVSVNLSAVQFSDAELVGDVAAALAATGLPPHRLELEVTETLLLQDSDINKAILESLHRLGIRIVLDDFGTGYSSLEYLRRFKFDKMKIDKSLLRGLPDRSTGDIILRGIIGLGQDLDIPITVEGVETVEQLAFLRGTGCLQAQGYLFSKPVPAAELASLLAASFPRLQPVHPNEVPSPFCLG